MEVRQVENRNAFTLIELLVVIAVIALLLGILMPSLVRARNNGRQVVCLSNMRQMVMAARTYVAHNDGYFTLAQLTKTNSGIQHEISWDFQKTMQAGQVTDHGAGLLWQGEASSDIQQCPSFKGAANSVGDKHTGYNYNASYIGGIFTTDFHSGKLVGVDSTRESQVRQPGACAVFGDGQYRDGANKFMRSPFVGKLDAGYANLRPYGTQGFRHSGKTNAAYADGSASVVKKRYTETYESLKGYIAEETGFLSEDNRAYDLR